ncbi:MAG: sugar phosphate isomerase/epimerase [Peptococcaceae bacterium]|nr:sugar phosphate isomerase/epimerase [Peptococcaceae bacterium]
MMKIGIQLYSVRKHMARNPIQTLEQVAKTGYRYLETANHQADKDYVTGFGLSSQDTNELLLKLGVQIVSAHISPLDPKDQAHIHKVLSQQQAIGVKYVATNLHDFPNREVTLYYADFLSKLGEMCAQYGIQLLYHNHFAEFRKFDGETVYDILMNHVDPALLKIQLDTYWAMRGGADPADLMKKYGGRVRVLHQKDYPEWAMDRMNMLTAYERNLQEAAKDLPADTEEGRKSLSARELDERVLKVLLAELDPATFVEIGTGIMDIQKLIDTANNYCQTEYIILEQDHTQLDEMDSIRVSMDNFKKFSGIIG